MRNCPLVEGFCAENVTGLKPVAEAVVPVSQLQRSGGRGAFCVQRSYTVRCCGARRSENAGMSSVYLGENPGRRKSEVSYATSFDVGLVGPKPRPQGAGDG